jgi:hypothetical protein
VYTAAAMLGGSVKVPDTLGSLDIHQEQMHVSSASMDVSEAGSLLKQEEGEEDTEDCGRSDS